MQIKSYKSLEYPKVLQLLSQEAKSALGREKCLDLRPASSFADSLRLLQETDDVLRELQRNGELPLAALEDLTELLSLLKLGSVPSPAELLDVAKQLQLVSRLKARFQREKEQELSTIAEEASSSSLYRQLLEDLYALNPLYRSIDEAILNDEELKDKASPELYRLRRQIQALQEEVQASLQRILRSKAEYLQEQLITLRDGRYVIPVKAEHKGRISGIVHGSSATGQTVFLEPMQVVSLNNRIREVQMEEAREVQRILAALGAQVYAHHVELSFNQEALVYLDFTQAKAKLAQRQHAVQPQLNQQGHIRLKQARHPLIPPEQVVAIDFELGLDFTTLVITGPNTGGKTVSLKTCGLLTLMAMSGLFIPAEAESEISYFQYVLADIGDEQSIEQSLSTFSSHITQIIKICEIADPGTLVLVDELGAGTDPSEGAALAIAILDFLRRRGAHVVASTHYQELKAYALNAEGVSNACCEFDSISMRPTYRLLIGVPGVSNALAISTRLGLPAAIIEQAKALISDEGAEFQSLINAIEISHRETLRMEEEIAVLHQELEQKQVAITAAEQSLREQRERIIREARQEAHEIISSAEEQAEAALKSIREEHGQIRAGEEAKKYLRDQRLALEAIIEEEKLAAGIDQPLRFEDLQEGVYYEDVLSGLSGQLSEKNEAKDEVLLSRGNVNFRVPISNLRLQAKSRNSSRQVTGFSRFSTKKQAVNTSQKRLHTSSELYLLGYRVNAALDELDQYLDDAILVGLRSVRIVHGKGSGALRQAIRSKLEHDKRVAHFADAPFGAGDAGVTIVELS